MSGAPTPAELQQVAEIVKMGQNYANREQVTYATTFLEQHSADPRFNSCLAVVASSPQGAPEPVRHQAALSLKNNIIRSFEKAVSPSLPIFQEQLLGALADPNDGIRSAIASCVSEIAKTGAWPTLISLLWPKLTSTQDKGLRSGIMVCVRDICENCGDQLETGGPNNQVQHLIPGLLELITTSADPREVQLGVGSLFYLLDHQSIEKPSPIDEKIQQMLAPVLRALGRCLSLASGPHGKEIAKDTLKCYRLLLYYYGQLKQSGELSKIQQVVFSCTGESDPEIKLAACEFWFDMMENDEAVSDLCTSGMLPELAVLLLKNMVYSEMEVELINHEEESENVKPRGKGKKRGDDDDEGDVEQWTVRTCAAATLDFLANKQGPNLISPPGRTQGWFLLEILQPMLGSPDWKVQESALLSLGAIAKGCFDYVSPHLAQLVPAMFQALATSSVHFLVRGITCWTLSRYVTWIAPQKEYFEKYLNLLLQCMGEPKRKVQECSVSSFAVLLEWEYKKGGFLSTNPEYISSILQHVNQCLQPGRYTTRNTLILLDAIGYLGASFGSELATPEGARLLLDPLLKNMLQSLPEHDTVVLPHLMYCISYFIRGMDAQFAQYVEPVYQRCFQIIGKFFESQFRYKSKEIAEPLDLGQNHILAVELIKTLMTCLHGTEMNNLIANTKYPGTNFTFVDFVMFSFTMKDLELEQDFVMTSVNCIGENIAYYPQLFQQRVYEAIPSIVEFCSEDTALCNDCAWFCGEIAMTLEKAPQEQSAQIIGVMAQKLVPILIESKWEENLLQNVAIAVGKFGLIQGQLMASQLGQFLKPLLQHLTLVVEVEDSPEKAQAFLGVVAMLRANFNVLENMDNIKSLAKGMSSFVRLDMKQELVVAFCTIVQALKEALKENWSTVVQNVAFPPVVIAHLK
ncbi:Transportin-1 [Diplonema papillatum]|nr:Transportin-1 [Diplonema papillatum]